MERGPMDEEMGMIAEIYSPPRVTTEAANQGMDPGWAMDLQNGWDLSCPKQRGAALKKIRETKPQLIIGSPPCTQFSSLQRWNHRRMAPAKVHELKTKAEAHMNFMATIYKE